MKTKLLIRVLSISVALFASGIFFVTYNENARYTMQKIIWSNSENLKELSIYLVGEPYKITNTVGFKNVNEMFRIFYSQSFLFFFQEGTPFILVGSRKLNDKNKVIIFEDAYGTSALMIKNAKELHKDNSFRACVGKWDGTLTLLKDKEDMGWFQFKSIPYIIEYNSENKGIFKQKEAESNCS